MEIAKNKVVSMHYKGTLKDGSVFDSSEGRDPLVFIYGTGMIIPGLESGMEGLAVGDKKSIEVAADDAYGPVHEEAKQEIPKDKMPQDVEIKAGMQLAAQGPHGMIPVTVSEVKDDVVVIDMNHPLAGKDLVFDIEIVDVRDATEEELSHGHVHGPDGHHHHH